MERLRRGSDLALVESSTLNVERLRRVSKGEGGAAGVPARGSSPLHIICSLAFSELVGRLCQTPLLFWVAFHPPSHRYGVPGRNALQ